MRFFTFFLTCSLLLAPLFSYAAEGTIRILPERGTVLINDEFELVVYAYPDGENVNAAEAEIVFDPTILEVALVSTSGSALSLWPTPPTYSNQEGVVRFSGWADASFREPQTRLLSIIFRARVSGNHTVRISSGALLQAGTGSNIVTALGVSTVDATPELALVSPDSGAVLGAATVSNDAPPPQPTITTYSTDLVRGDRFLVSGKTLPDASVAILLFSESGALFERGLIRADQGGGFTYISEKRLSPGTYTFAAESYSSFGVLGKRTREISVSVLESPNASLLAAVSLRVGAPLAVWGTLLVLGFVAGFMTLRTLMRRRSEDAS